MYKGMIASFNLSIQEFGVLLSCCKVKKIYGFFTGEMFNLQKNEVENVIFSLSKKGVITVKGKEIEVRPDIRKFIYSIANYKKVISVTSANDYLPERNLYISDVLIEIIFKGLSSDRIMINVSEKELLQERLKEFGFGIESFADRDVSDEEIGDEKIKSIAKKLTDSKREDVLKTEGVIFLVSILDCEGTKQLVLYKQGVDKYIFIDSEVYLYSKGNLKMLVTKYMEG